MALNIHKNSNYFYFQNLENAISKFQKFQKLIINNYFVKTIMCFKKQNKTKKKKNY